jgi:prophage tail gpP-like protein
MNTPICDFINEYAQKVSALLITNEDGNIVITRAGNHRYSDKLLNEVGNENNNILSSSAGYDYSQRFYKYIVYSQNNANTQTSNITIDNVAQKGIAYDTEIRQSRVLVMKANNACNSGNCQEIATLEANIRRANSLKYKCDVYGFQTNNGELWKTNRLIQVFDEDNDIDSELLIKGVTFNLGEGSTTTLDFALADAYTLQASLDEVNGRVNKTKTAKKEKKGKGKKDKSLSEAELSKILGF